MDYRLIQKESVSSTNSYLLSILPELNKGEEIIVIADYQTDGRGRGESSWFSSKGRNILLSWLIYPEFLSASGQFRLSKAVSLAIYDLVSKFTNNVSIKWPNDILVRDMKIAGILIENGLMEDRITYSIIGIGLNVNENDFPSVSTKPTSLFNETGIEHDTGVLAGELINNLYGRYEQLQDDELFQIDKEYIRNLYRYNEIHEYALNDRSEKGIIRDVSESGELIVEFNGKPQRFNIGEITFLPADRN